jgi:hypothetical protein
MIGADMLVIGAMVATGWIMTGLATAHSNSGIKAMLAWTDKLESWFSIKTKREIWKVAIWPPILAFVLIGFVLSIVVAPALGIIGWWKSLPD